MRNTAAKQINVRIKTKYSANLSNKSHFIIYDITWGGDDSTVSGIVNVSAHIDD
jgi:hypothetical protein